MSGIELIAAERERQLKREGWTPEHDDEHENGELALAAACYAAHDEYLVVNGKRLVLEERFAKSVEYTDPWPWDEEFDKRDKHDRIRQLAIAGALIAAEIDRLERATPVELWTKGGDVKRNLAIRSSCSLPHETVPIQVWADVDEGIAPLVKYLNTIPGVRTHASCQGTIGQGGAEPYRPYALASYQTEEAEMRLRQEFDCSEVFMATARVHPRDGWIAPEENCNECGGVPCRVSTNGRSGTCAANNQPAPPEPREPAAREAVRVIDRNEDKTSVEVLVNGQWFPVSWPSYSQDAELYANRIKAAIEAYSAELRATHTAQVNKWDESFRSVENSAKVFKARAEATEAALKDQTFWADQYHKAAIAAEASLLQARLDLKKKLERVLADAKDINGYAVKDGGGLGERLLKVAGHTTGMIIRLERELASTSAPEGT